MWDEPGPPKDAMVFPTMNSLNPSGTDSRETNMEPAH